MCAMTEGIWTAQAARDADVVPHPPPEVEVNGPIFTDEEIDEWISEICLASVSTAPLTSHVADLTAAMHADENIAERHGDGPNVLGWAQAHAAYIDLHGARIEDVTNLRH